MSDTAHAAPCVPVAVLARRAQRAAPPATAAAEEEEEDEAVRDAEDDAAAAAPPRGRAAGGSSAAAGPSAAHAAPAGAGRGSFKLYIGGLPYTHDEHSVRALFEGTRPALHRARQCAAL